MFDQSRLFRWLGTLGMFFMLSGSASAAPQGPRCHPVQQVEARQLLSDGRQAEAPVGLAASLTHATGTLPDCMTAEDIRAAAPFSLRKPDDKDWDAADKAYAELEREMRHLLRDEGFHANTVVTYFLGR